MSWSTVPNLCKAFASRAFCFIALDSWRLSENTENGGPLYPSFFIILITLKRCQMATRKSIIAFRRILTNRRAANAIKITDIAVAISIPRRRLTRQELHFTSPHLTSTHFTRQTLLMKPTTLLLLIRDYPSAVIFMHQFPKIMARNFSMCSSDVYLNCASWALWQAVYIATEDPVPCVTSLGRCWNVAGRCRTRCATETSRLSDCGGAQNAIPSFSRS